MTGGNMTRIVLNSEQAAILDNATEPVRVCMPDGSIAGWLKGELVTKGSGFTPEEIAEAERRAERSGPGRTTKEVFDRLRALEDT
jgi:hypothetical protein